MLQLLREYQIDIYDLDRDVRLRRRHMGVLVCADSPMAQSQDFEPTLTLLNERIGGWLQGTWHQRWLISTEPEADYAKRTGIAACLCPLPVHPGNLAEYLLDAVLEPLLRGTGLLVRHVEVWVPGLPAGKASLNDEVAELYESEMGARPEEYRRNAPIFASKQGIECVAYPYNAYSFHNKSQAKKLNNGAQ